MLPKETILGHYRLLQRIGLGGMGEVYVAEDTRIARQVAIKIVRTEPQPYPDSEATQEASRLFRREMKAIAMLDHRNILSVIDFGEETIEGVPVTYMIMPYRKEGSLNEWLQRYKAHELLSPHDVDYLLSQAADALQHAHEHHIIHQDVKPSNFLIREKANDLRHPDLLLTDFGVAKLTNATATASQHVRGTPTFMPAEQWESQPVPATDQYALAVLAYLLLTGRTPFVGRMEQVIRQHMMTPPPPPSTYNSEITPAIDAVILRALAKKPEERFPSMLDFTRAFHQATLYSGDLHTTLRISMAEALAGVERTITLPGKRPIAITVPQNAQDGQEIRVEGQSEPYYEGGPRGLLFLKLAISKGELRERKQEPRETIQVFFSYARRDQNLRDQLENHLSNLKYRGLITTWHAREISAGEETIQQIDIHLDTAHIILLLISANFLASEYCYSREMMLALQRHERGEAHVIPVLLRPVVFTGAPFARLQPLPTNGKPVVNWRNRDSAFVDIALGIERVVQKRFASTKVETSSIEHDALQNVQAQSLYGPPPIAEPYGLPLPPPYASNMAEMAEVTSPSASPRVPSRSRRGSILVGLSLLGLLSAGILLVQHPNFIPFVGVIAGSLILLAGVLLAIRTLVKRAQSRATRSREQEQAQRRQLEEARRREQAQIPWQQFVEARSREQEQAQRRQLEEARRREQEQAQRQGNEKALVAYEQALHLNNADATAYQGKGNALVGLERYDEAFTAFEQAVILTPLPTAYVSMGNVLETLGRYEGAVAAYEQALALDGSYAPAYSGMSKALLQLGRKQEAERAHEQAKQLGDDD